MQSIWIIGSAVNQLDAIPDVGTLMLQNSIKVQKVLMHLLAGCRLC